MITAFLEALFPDLRGGYIEIREIGVGGDVEAFFFASVEEAAKHCGGRAADPVDANIYFGVCPRSDRRGGKSAVRVAHALWADVDGKDFAGGKPEALERLRGFNPRPTIITDSGNGFHAYWRLRTPVEVSSPDAAALVERHLRALAQHLGADAKSAELARILRVPGTLNLKNFTSPIRVKVVECELDQRWNLADFSLPEPPRSPVSGGNPTGWIAESLESLRDGNRNDTFTKVVGRLHHGAWTQAEIFALLIPHARAVQFPESELRTLVDGLCRRYPTPNPFQNSLSNREKSETERPPAETLHVTQLLAAGPAEISWCVEGIIPMEGAAIVGAPHGHGKSWLLLDMGIDGSRGGRWLGQFQMAKGPVLYIDEESTPTLLRVRVSKLLKAKGLNPEDLDLHFCTGQGISIDTEAGLQRLRLVLERIRPILVIVDTLIRVHSADENSATEMARVFRNVKRLSTEFGCAFAFADHQRKPDRVHSSLDFMLRGSTEKPAFVDTLLSLKRRDQDLIVEHSKSRYTESVAPFLVRIEDPEDGATAVVHLGDAAGAIRAEKEEAAQALLDSALEGGEWVARQDLAEAAKEAKVPVKVLDAELARRESDGCIEKERRPPPSGKGNKAAFYRLKPAGSVIPFPDSAYIGGESETDSEGPVA